MDSARPYSDGLVQVHGLTLGLMLGRLFQSLTLLLPVLPILLFFDVNLLNLAGSLTVRSRCLASGLTEGGQREIRTLRAFRSVGRGWGLSGRRLVHAPETV